MSEVIRVVIVEDQREVREGLATLLDATPGFVCSASFGRMEDALVAVAAIQPGLMLVDLGLPGMQGTEGISVLRDDFPAMPILALTVYDDDERVFAALCAGASGYLLKNTSSERLVTALNDAMMGGSPMSPEVARHVVRLFREFRPPARSEYRLTSHEVELLKLLIDGHHYKTAADALGVTTNTVSYHLKNIYTKLQVHSKSEAVAKALRERIV